MSRPVDSERVTTLLGVIRGALALLREISRSQESEFLKDPHRQGSAKYQFIVAIEAAIDVANHFISRRGFRAPEDYADTFRVLAEGGLLEAAFALELEKMARFRNRLVHLYRDVDPSEVWHILQSRLGDLERYCMEIGTHAAAEHGPSHG